MSRISPHGIGALTARAGGSPIRRLLGLLFTALILALMSVPTPAWAHAELLSTTPAEGSVLSEAPSSVEFVFDEPVFLVPDGFQLYDGSGGHRTMQADAAEATVRVTLPSHLAEGSYVLGWRVTSDDSHPESGVLSFVVGHAGASVPTIAESDAGPVDVLYGVLTGLGYVGLFGLVGVTVFDLYVTRATTSRRLPPRIAAYVALGAYLILVPLTTVRERGLGLGALLDPAVVTTGWSGGAALTLLLAADGATLMLLRPRLPRRAGFLAGTAGALAALSSVLPVGHTRTFEPRWLVMGADLVHAATAAVWLGGLVALILHLARSRRRGGDPADSAVILGRFSSLAGGLVVLLGITGTILGVVIVGSVPALIGSTYGRLLLAKLAMVAMIGGLAAWNRWGLVPHLAREQFTGRAWDRLSLAIRLEAVGLILVLGLTSALTLQNPRENEASAASATTATATATAVDNAAGTPVLADLGTGHLTGRFGSGTVGVNTFIFTLTDAGGAPIVPLDLPQVTVSEPNLSLGPVAADVEPGETPGSYRAVVVLPAAGQWKITAAVRINELERPAATADVVVVG